MIRIMPSESPDSSAGPVEPGAEISAGGRAAGTITSAGDGPGGPVALGYVKTSVLNEGAALAAGNVIIRVI